MELDHSIGQKIRRLEELIETEKDAIIDDEKQSQLGKLDLAELNARKRDHHEKIAKWQKEIKRLQDILWRENIKRQRDKLRKEKIKRILARLRQEKPKARGGQTAWLWVDRDLGPLHDVYRSVNGYQELPGELLPIALRWLCNEYTSQQLPSILCLVSPRRLDVDKYRYAEIVHKLRALASKGITIWSLVIDESKSPKVEVWRFNKKRLPEYFTKPEPGALGVSCNTSVEDILNRIIEGSRNARI